MKQALTKNWKQLVIILWSGSILLLYLYYLGLAQGGLQKALKLVGIS